MPHSLHDCVINTSQNENADDANRNGKRDADYTGTMMQSGYMPQTYEGAVKSYSETQKNQKQPYADQNPFKPAVLC